MKRRAILAVGVTAAQVQRAESSGLRARPEGDGPILRLQGDGTPAGRIAVFGQAFRAGDVPRGGGVVARLASGAALPVQVDVHARHADGSARLAVIALACPALARGATADVMLSAAPRAAEAPGDAGPWLAGRQASVAIGDAWRIDLLALLPAALAARAWQRGPLAQQARITAAIPPGAAGGVASLRLVADVAVRVDGTLWVDAWLRNDAAMQPNGGEATYALRLRLDGVEVLRAAIARQAHYTGWGRMRGTAPPPPRLRHDAGYLADLGAVARYDLTTGVAETVLRRLGDAMAAPAWAMPLNPRGIAQDMRQTGARDDIGPATMAQATWLMTGDARAAGYAEGQAEAAGAIPWHFWDAGRDVWMRPEDWRGLWTDGRGGPAPGGLLQPIAADAGWVPDCAHQPDLSFVPFLLTGRRALLDNLQAQAAWCILSQPPNAASRGTAASIGAGEGVNVVRGNQLRGAAWSLRQIDNAAWASPDWDPARAWLRAAAAGNWSWLRGSLPAWSAQQGEAQGWIPAEYGTPNVLPPWQQDHFASTAANAARRGDADARAVLAWMAQFLVGRFVSARRGFPSHDGVAYLIAIRSAGGSILRSWADIGAETRARGLSNGEGWAKTQGDYAQLGLQSLAAISDVLQLPEAAQAYRWLSAAAAPFTRTEDFVRDPILHIVPRRS